MTMELTMPNGEPRRLGRSVGAVVGGILVGALLSLGTDQALHALGFFAPWGQVTHDALPYGLAIVYRSAYAVFGFYVIARLAPRQPAKHVWVGAAVGLAASLAGVAAALSSDMGPIWYPVALAVTTIPCAWLANAIYRKLRAPR